MTCRWIEFATLALLFSFAPPLQAQQVALSPDGVPAVAATPRAAAAKVTPLDLDATPIALGGKLADPALWAAYKARFLTDQGRIIDTANGMISHSEGQGYGMLLAVAANDRQAFERIWGWTRANLKVRNDDLFAWRFDQDKRPGVADVNNATDGDILIAWALTEAAEFWADQSYLIAGRRIAVDIGRLVLARKTTLGTMVLPAIDGFGTNEAGGKKILNLSYFIFPAFERLKIAAPEVVWDDLIESGLRLLRSARFGSANLPSEWIALGDNKVTTAEGFPAVFGYNAIRIPLYMAWAGIGERADYAPFAELWNKTDNNLSVVNLKTGTAQSSMGEPGYDAIAALTACVVSGAKFPAQTPAPTQNYFPATLQMMSLLAAKMRYPSCVP